MSQIPKWSEVTQKQRIKGQYAEQIEKQNLDELSELKDKLQIERQSHINSIKHLKLYILSIKLLGTVIEH